MGRTDVGGGPSTDVHRGVSDPEQSWILAELIQLEHPRSGALDFTTSWVPVRDAVLLGTLRQNDRALGRAQLDRYERLIVHNHGPSSATGIRFEIFATVGPGNIPDVVNNDGPSTRSASIRMFGMPFSMGDARRVVVALSWRDGRGRQNQRVEVYT